MTPDTLSTISSINRSIVTCSRCPRRCAPPGNKRSRLELERCRPYLAAELRLLRRVRVVVTLGRIAHESWLKAAGWWQRLAPRDRPPFGHGVASHLPDGSVVIASYHP